MMKMMRSNFHVFRLATATACLLIAGLSINSYGQGGTGRITPKSSKPANVTPSNSKKSIKKKPSSAAGMSLKSRLLGAWEKDDEAGFIETYHPNGEGTTFYKGQECHNFKYKLTGNILRMIEPGESKCERFNTSGGTFIYRIVFSGEKLIITLESGPYKGDMTFIYTKIR